jgi:hypothetical protein
LCSGISTQDWKANSALLKAGFICFDCPPSTQQTGVFFSSSFNVSSAALPFHGCSTLVHDPPFASNDSLLGTSFSTSVLQDLSNLAIAMTNADLLDIGTETPPVADTNAAVTNTAFNLQEYIDDISFPPPPPPLSPNNLPFDLEFPIDLTLPPPPYPSDEDIFFNESLPFPPPPEFSTVNVESPKNNELIFFRPNFNSSYVEGHNMFANFSQGAAAIEWYHSPSVSPIREDARANFGPTFYIVEVPINRTPTIEIYSTYRKSLEARENLMQKRCFCSPLSATFFNQMF